MKIELSKKPKNPTVISGFPGFGLVGMIATEYLVNHLDIIEIGRIWSDKLPPIAAIHDNQLIQPLQIFYNKKYNLVIVQGLAAAHGSEWAISEAIVKLAKSLKAKEIVSLESVASKTPTGTEVYVYSSDKKKRAVLSKNFKMMSSGVIVGVTGAILINAEHNITATCFFAETVTGLPDSKSAADLIKALDSYLGLKIDYKPLLKQAEVFEKKLKGMMQQAQTAFKTQKEKKDATSYFG